MARAMRDIQEKAVRKLLARTEATLRSTYLPPHAGPEVERSELWASDDSDDPVVLIQFFEGDYMGHVIVSLTELEWFARESAEVRP